MAIQNDINDTDETAQQFQSSIYEYFLQDFGSHENSNEDEFSVKYANYSKNRLKKVLKTLKNDEKSDLSEVTYVSRLLRSKLSKGEKSYQPNLGHSYKYGKISGAIVKKYSSQNRLYSPLLIGPLVSVILKTLSHVKIRPEI